MSGRTWQLPAETSEVSSQRRAWNMLRDPRLSVLDIGIYLVISEGHPRVYEAWELAARGYGAVTLGAVQRSLDHLTNLDYLECTP